MVGFNGLRFSTIALSYAVLLGCMVGPNFKTPLTPYAENYTESPVPKTVSSPVAGGKSQTFLIASIPAQWWTLFHSPELNRLITCAFANSPNIFAAQAALRVARQNLRAGVGGLFPSVDAQFFSQRERFSEAAFGIGDATTKPFDLFNAQVNVSYTFDMFGGIRREIEALCAAVDYQRYQLEATYLTLAANVATTAIVEASIRAQIKATEEIISFESSLVDITKKQFELGAISQISVLAQETQLAQTLATLPPLEKSLVQNRHLLAVLLGELPSDNDLPGFVLEDLQLPTELPISVPSTLLRRRPDVRAAEALVHQASAQIGVATANLLPQITLTGYYGWESMTLGTLFSPRTNIWSILGQALQPVFHGGTLLAKKRAAVATYDQVLAQYQQIVLQAFQNVADALKAIEIDAKTLKAQAEAEAAALASLKLNREQYQLGGVDYLMLLDAERQYQTAIIARLQAQAARLTDTAALFQALGGGWWEESGMLNGPLLLQGND